MTKCNVRDELGCLVQSRVYDYYFVDLAGEQVLFAFVDYPGKPTAVVAIEYLSGALTKAWLRKPATPALLRATLDSWIKTYGATATLGRIKELRDTEWSFANEADF